MPKLPDAQSLGQRPTPSPAMANARYQPTTGAEDAQARALMAFGDDMGQVSDQLFRAQEKIDTLRAEEAFTELRNQQLDMTNGEEGFAQRRGRDALGKPFIDDYVQRFDTATETIGNKLDDRARKLFNKRSQVAKLQYRQDLLGHSAKEADTYARQVFESSLDSEIKNASNHWQNPKDVALSLERIKFVISEEADRLNLPAKKTKALRDDAISKVHANVIERMLINDQDLAASVYYQGNKKQVMGDDAAPIEKALAEGSLRGESRRRADEIFGKYQTEGQALAEVDKIKDPKVADATRQRVKQKYADDQNEYKLSLEKAYTDALQTVEASGSTDNIPPNKWVNVLTEDHRKALEKRAAEIREGKEPELNKDKWMAFLDLPTNKLAALNQDEVDVNYLMHFDRDRRIEALNRWQSARKSLQGDPMAKVEHASTIQFDDIVDGLARQMNVLPKGKSKAKLSQEQWTRYNALRTGADTEIKQFERNELGGKRKATSEEMTKIVNRVMAKQVFVDEWGTDPQRPVVTLTEEERGQAYIPIKKIPAESVLALRRKAEEMGITINQRQIERAYAAAVMDSPDEVIIGILEGR